MAVVPAQNVDAPAATAVPYGLFSVLTFRGAGDPHWQNGVTWQNVTCSGVLGRGLPGCPPADPEAAVPGMPKDFDGDPYLEADATPFALYAPFKCSPVGISPATAQGYASDRLTAREEQGAEYALWTGAWGNTPSFRDSADNPVTTLGTGRAPIAALAALEQFAGSTYGGRGVIHLTRDVATVLSQNGALVASGSALRTTLGTPVVAGTGYDGSGPDGAAPADNTKWAYVTPPLVGYRGDIVTSSDTAGDLLDRSTNDLYAIAERVYLIGFDPCGIGAVSIDLTATGGGGGDVGPAGASAYEIAVQNGFEGTEQEWLASLVGPAGADGADGADGPQGDPGVVQTIVAGDGIAVDATDPANPVVSAAAGA